MSSSLVWEIVRNGHAYIKNCNGMKFSQEPGNLTGRHNRHDSAFGNERSVGVFMRKGRAHLTLIRNSKCGHQRKVTQVVIRPGCAKAVDEKVINVLRHFRPDAIPATLKRLAIYTRVHNDYMNRHHKARAALKKKIAAKKAAESAEKQQ